MGSEPPFWFIFRAIASEGGVRVLPFKLHLDIMKRKNLIEFGGSRSKGKLGGVWTRDLV